MVLTKAAGHTVVGDDTVLGHHGAVAHPTNVELLPLVDVHQLEELGYVGATEVELAQWGHVNEADVGTHIGGFGHGIAVLVGTNPLPSKERRRPVGLVPVLQGRATYRLEDPPGEGAQRDRRVRRAPHGGPDVGHVDTVCLSQHRSGVNRLELALGRTHGHGGVPLHELDGVETLLGGLDEVLGRNILGEVDHAVGTALVALRMRVASKRCAAVGHLFWLSPSRSTGTRRLANPVVPATKRPVGRQLAGGPTMGLQLDGRPVAGDAPCSQNVAG